MKPIINSSFFPFLRRILFKTFLTVMFLIGIVAPCQSEVVFVHDVKNHEFIMGDQEVEIIIGYGPESMLIDMETRYTGSWMKRLFGKVEKDRETTLVLLEKDEIREVDWSRDKIIVFPLTNLADIKWVSHKMAIPKEAQEIIEKRYKVLDPQFSLNTFPEYQEVNGYRCRVVEVLLRLETLDLRKNASSVTLVKQRLWLADDAPGYKEQLNFHRRLAERLGLDAERLGNLNFILRYWKGSLEPIKELLAQAKGFRVKSILTVDAQYITQKDSLTPKLITKRLKDETIQLRDIRQERTDQSLFQLPDHFSIVTVR